MRQSDLLKLTRLLNSSKVTSGASHSKRKRKPKKRSNLVKQQLKLPNSSHSLDAMIKSSMFRFLNEKLYSCTSDEALKLFTDDQQAFEIYHTGFQQQLSQWPDDPLQWVVGYLNTCRPETGKKFRIADMGCGDARLADSLNEHFKVYSFDLVAVNEKVTACDMAHTPVKSTHMHFVVFCLSLMGTNCREFIYEANRLLKSCGKLLIVDITSRFDGQFSAFLKKLKRFGFQTEFSETTKDTYFVRARLSKFEDCTTKPVSALPPLKLNPCVYKKR